MKHLESKLQVSCIRWLDLQYPHLKKLCFAVPNGGARSASQGRILKAEGVRAGVADLFLAVPNIYVPKVKEQECSPSGITTIYEWKSIDDLHGHGLFIEMKVDKGKQTDSQIAFEKAVTEQGYAYVVVRSFEQFKELINNWMK